MALEPEVIELIPGDLSAGALAPVLEPMRRLAATRDGWVNLHPLVPEEDLPKNTMGFFGWLSARGPGVPQATWVPGPPMRRDPSQHEPDSVGLQHPGGPKARFRLEELGVPVPAGWVVKGDHPRRGLVMELPDGTDPGEIVPWLLRAARALTDIPMPERWIAAVYQRR